MTDSDHQNAVVPVGELHVRTLYDYEADDGTSLSFRQGDIIQVVTQLETGWWYGIMNFGTESEARGWFPSNYCTIIPSNNNYNAQDECETEGDDDEDIDYVDDSDEEQDRHGINDAPHANGYPREQSSAQSIESDKTGTTAITTPDRQQNEGSGDVNGGGEEDAAFWIPQATPDGRLYYVNTSTGETTLDLPLVPLTSASEDGPKNRMNVHIPEHSKIPPEIWAAGYGRNGEVTGHERSISDVDATAGNRRSYTSDGVSPATSMESINAGSPIRSRYDPKDPSSSSFSVVQTALPDMSTATTSFTSNSHTRPPYQPVPSRRYYDASQAVPLTWNRLVEDMRRAIERYRRAINNSDRSEFVKRAEDISDHLRLLLAAGSGTTDNHSGNPSIISTNRALYPHFREMMSRFSKLVLSSHIAAADWPPPDSYAKCFQEADGVLNGVYGFVEVARQQRGGEDIPRLVPGFVFGSRTGGSWQNNGVKLPNQPNDVLFVDQDEHQNSFEAVTALNSYTVGHLNHFKGLIVANMQQLEEMLYVRENIITPARHRQISDRVCKAAKSVLEYYRSWFGTVESIDLSSLAGGDQQSLHMNDFAVEKQRVYDLVSELVIACQGVAAPLSDEWAELKLASLEDRFDYVRTVCKDLELSTTQVNELLQRLSELCPQQASKSAKPRTPVYDQTPTTLGKQTGNRDKIITLLGPDVPVPRSASPPPFDENLPFLGLEHEMEIVYDDKGHLKGGSLTSLVEQLTRHDRLDSNFNDTFLLNYRSFTSASELLELLMRRWNVQPPLGLSQKEYKIWVERKQKLIRIRVVKCLRSWIDSYWLEPNTEASQVLLQKLLAFGKGIISIVGTTHAAQLISAVEQRMRGQDTNNKIIVPTPHHPLPAPILPRNMKKLKFLDIDVLELARQLTIMDSKLYGKIRRSECLSNMWQKKPAPGEPDPAANVKAVILNSNQLSNWVAQMILTQDDVKRRVMVIKQFVQVADKCRTLNNYSTLFSIICAFGTAPISRLKRTWDAVNRRIMTLLDGMRDLMDSTRRFRRYREALLESSPPCVPFIGVYLTDLIFTEEGIPSQIRGQNAINFGKWIKTTEVIREIQRYQNEPYALQPVPELQEYIAENMATAGDVHEMYDRSLAVEPREKEREDDRIARLLSESGFL